MALRTHHQFGRTRVALVTAIALLSQPLTPVMGQTAASQATAQKPAAATAAPTAARSTTAPPASAAGAVDGGWPRAYTTNSGAALVLYQPQVS